MVLKRRASPKEFGTFKFENCVKMLLNSFVIPGKNWTNSEVLKVTLGCLVLHGLEDIGLRPVFVHEKNRLRAALLTRVSIGILITLPSNVVNLILLLGDIRAHNLPVITTIFELDLTSKFLG